MGTPRKLLALAVGLGISVWILDAAFDAVFFYEGASFVGLLLTAIPVHELYIRLLIFLLVISFGVVAARQAARLEEQQRQVSLFRRVVDEANDSVIVIDPSTGQFEDVNETACDVLGYDRSTLLEMSVADINDQFEDSAAFREFIESPGGETLTQYETTHRRADGTTVPIEISASDVTLEDRTLRIAIARDISERKRREQRTHHYKQAVESSHDLLTALDADCRYLFANEAYCAFHDVEQATIRGTDLEDVIGPAEFERVEPHLQTALSGEQIEFETTRRHPTDGERTLDVRYFPLRDADGDIHGIGSSIRDITERIEMIEDLRRSRERYESLFNSIRDAILVADTDGRIVDCNPAFTDLFGYSLTEITGKPTAFLHESESEFEAMGDSLARQMEDPTFVQTVNYQRQSGQVFPGETNVFYLRDRDGEITGFIGLIRDVSERVERITQIRTIDRVLRHNLTNALTVIFGNAEMITETTSGTPRHHAERILSTGEKLRETSEKVRDITSFLADSRPSAHRDIGAIIETVVAEVGDRHPNADITVALRTTKPVFAVEFIDRALEELLENAMTHSDHDRPSVTVTTRAADGVVEIDVADDGPGIPEMEQQVLTGEREIEPLYHGSGIGLWLVHLIVTHSDGTLEFAENDPRGSVVTVRLPAADDGTE